MGAGMAGVEKPDLDNAANIERFVDLFYERILEDQQLAPIFLDVAKIDLAVHLPHIKHYWRKLLLGERTYKRHTMNIHRALDSKRALQPSDFQRWLGLFENTIDSHYRGDRAERAKRVAASIAGNMQSTLGSSVR